MARLLWLVAGVWSVVKLVRIHELYGLMTRSSTASAAGIDNQPTGANAMRLVWTAAWVDPVLDVLQGAGFGGARLSSGYRSPELNALLQGSSATSYHRHGLAFDVGGLGVWAGPRAAARALRAAAPIWSSVLRTVIAEDDHLHLDLWDPLRQLTESRVTTSWLEQRESGGFVALRDNEV